MQLRFLQRLGLFCLALVVLQLLAFFIFPKNESFFETFDIEKSVTTTKSFDHLEFSMLSNLFSLESVDHSSICNSLVENIQFLGINSRPDCKQNPIVLVLSNQMLNLTESKKYPISYQEDRNYYIAEKEEILSLSCTIKHNKLHLKIFENQDSENILIGEYDLNQSPLKEEPKIGDQPIDAHLLIRQRAAWWGKDAFMESFGKEAFQHNVGRDRIDFQKEGQFYSIFLLEGDFFIFKDGSWVKSNVDSFNYPLLYVKSIDKSLMTLQVWDASGTLAASCSLSKFAGYDVPQDIFTLKYIGAKTFDKWIFYSGARRLVIEPGDWLLYTKNEGWMPLRSVEEIDRYLDFPHQGSLFIVKGLDAKEGKKVLAGSLVNPSRTKVSEYYFPIEK